jgi:hypothetical protein
MYYYLYRFYDPNLQRWLNQDPKGEPGFETMRKSMALSSLSTDQAKGWSVPAELSEGPNLYIFVDNDPINYVDPDGQHKQRYNPNYGKPNRYDEFPKELMGLYAKSWAEIVGSVAVGEVTCIKLFRGGGWLNSNRYLRIGTSRDGGRRVFRIAGRWVEQIVEDGHITLIDLGPL